MVQKRRIVAAGTADPELRQVAFEERADEGTPPPVALRVVRSEKGERKAAARPESRGGFGTRLTDRERRKIMVDNASRQGFGRLPEQLGSGAPQNEKAGRVVWPIHEDAQQPKEPLLALHLVDDDQPPKRFEQRASGRPTWLRPLGPQGRRR